jgi:hypothetical protein
MRTFVSAALGLALRHLRPSSSICFIAAKTTASTTMSSSDKPTTNGIMADRRSGRSVPGCNPVEGHVEIE